MLPPSHIWASFLGYIVVGTCTAISLPQMWQHWRTKKAEGISLTMLWLWLIGDLFGLAGTVVQGLLRTQIILGVINALIDSCIIWQCYYYNHFAQLQKIKNYFPGRRKSKAMTPAPPVTSGYVQRTPSIAVPPAVSIPFTINTARSRWWSIVSHLTFILLVVGLSILVWGVLVYRVRNTASLKDGEDGTDPKFSAAGAVFGWISMAIYTSSRYPQIHKNWRSKTCQGLSIWVFILLLIYNLNYLASILVKSTKHSYLVVNMPWIVNSIYNIVLDILIVGQFIRYRKNMRRVVEEEQVAREAGAVEPDEKI